MSAYKFYIPLNLNGLQVMNAKVHMMSADLEANEANCGKIYYNTTSAAYKVVVKTGDSTYEVKSIAFGADLQNAVEADGTLTSGALVVGDGNKKVKTHVENGFVKIESGIVTSTSDVATKSADSAAAGKLQVSGGADKSVADYAPSAAGHVKVNASGVVSVDEDVVTKDAASTAAGELIVSGGANKSVASYTTDGIVKVSDGVVEAAVEGTDYLTASSSNTLTNKTIDANGTGNSISNLEVEDFASGVIVTSIGSDADDDELATAKATKTFVENKIAGMGSFQGAFTPSADGTTLPSRSTGSVQSGDYWRVTANGKLGTVVLEAGDMVVAKESLSTPLAATDFFAVQANLSDTVSSSSSSSVDNALVRMDGTNGKVVQTSSATLSDDGDLIVASITSTDAASIGGSLDVTGDASFEGSLTVGDDGISTSGDASVGGDLTVTGAINGSSASLSGALSVTGAASVASLNAGSGKIETTGDIEGADITASGAMNSASAAISGNATVGGTLSVTGESSLADVEAGDVVAESVSIKSGASELKLVSSDVVSFASSDWTGSAAPFSLTLAKGTDHSVDLPKIVQVRDSDGDEAGVNISIAESGNITLSCQVKFQGSATIMGSAQ